MVKNQPDYRHIVTEGLVKIIPGMKFYPVYA